LGDESRMPLTRRIVLFLLASPVACRLLVAPGPSAVAQGRYFSTGNPNYDEFFVRLNRMQVELKTAPETLAQVRADLAKSVGAEPSADSAALGKALGEKVGEMSRRGTTRAVDHGHEPGARARLAGATAEPDRELVKTLDGLLARLSELRERSGPWQKELEWLAPAGVELETSVEAAFVGHSRGMRDDVHQNLADAQRVITLMSGRKKEIEQNGAELEGLFTAAFGERKAEPPPAPAPAPTPKASPRPAPKPAAPRPAPRPAPAAAAAPASDEQAPAPKPKQGTARPDFEP
ncbi:MAG TPA: hypothetical protein VF103_12725, partial [Polyangiaceae bacterium]